jgi:hypothetical protein
MKKTILTCFFAIFSLLIFAQITETRPVASFNIIDASSTFDITVVQGTVEKLSITADEAFLPHIKSEVVAGVLKLYVSESDKKFWKNAPKDQHFRAEITVKNLRAVRLSGACKLRSDDIFKTDDFDIRLSGASALEIKIESMLLRADLSGASHANLNADAHEVKVDMSGACKLKLIVKNAEKVSADLTGASKASISGLTDVANFDASGASSITADELLARTVNIESSGASSLTVNAAEWLRVGSSGASKIRYKGSPRMNLDTSGASSIRSIE